MFCLSQVLLKREVYLRCDRNNPSECNTIVVQVDCCVWYMDEIVRKLSEENFISKIFWCGISLQGALSR